MNRFLALGLLSFLVGCSPVYQVSYDYDRTVNFSRLRRYDWMAASENLSINKLDLRRIRNAVDSVLQAKGLEKSSDRPDFLIEAKLVKKEETDVSSWGHNFGFYGAPWWGRELYVYRYEEGTLILDAVKSGSKELLWRGAAKANLDLPTTPEERDHLINEAVQKMLSRFPPPGPG